MKTLLDFIINEDDTWTDDIKTEWHPEEGLFAGDDPEYIARYLMDNSDDEAQAMRRLVFYMNRAGENLTNKTVLNKVKAILKKDKKTEEE